MINFSNDYYGLFAALGIFFIIILLFFGALYVLYIIGKWKLFKKAGKNGWEAIIPFYSDWIYVEIADLNYWWFFLIISNTIFNILDIDYLTYLATIASILGLFVCNYNISKKLHKDVSFAILMTIFPFVMIPLIGLSNNYNWDSNITVSNNGPFKSSDNSNTTYTNNEYSNNINNNIKYCTNCGNKVDNSDAFCNNCGKKI